MNTKTVNTISTIANIITSYTMMMTLNYAIVRKDSFCVFVSSLSIIAYLIFIISYGYSFKKKQDDINDKKRNIHFDNLIDHLKKSNQ